MAISLRTTMHAANAVRILLLLVVALAGYWGINSQVALYRELAATSANSTQNLADRTSIAPENIAAVMKKSEQLALRANRILLGLTALGITVIILLGALFARRLSAPLWEAIKLAEKVVAGDLTVKFTSSSNDEAGQMIAALNRMVKSLDIVVRKARRSSEEVAKSAAEIAAGSNDLAARTEHQASTLEQTAASMEELAASTSDNLNQMREAKTVAQAAVSSAQESGVAVKNAVEIMGQVDASSKRIADIVGLIDGIAFQTNILALNAAVEAARAGEQGRGFAVVAQEVRLLAQKSAVAAKEIRGLVDGSLDVVAQSNALISDAGDKMHTTLECIRQLAELVDQTELASSEQVGGIQHVNQAILQLEEVTQRNATLVEQATAAAESQEQQAQYLVELVGQFKLDELSTGLGSGQPISRSSKNMPVKSESPWAIGSAANSTSPAKLGAVTGKAKSPNEDTQNWQEF